MAVRLFLAVMALVGLMWFFAWYGKADAAQRARALKLALLWGVAGIVLLLVVTGRLHWPFALLAVLTPWIQRYVVARQAWNTYKSARGPRAGQTSEVSTQYLHAILNHDTGEMTGRVLQGRYRDRPLESLQPEELLELLIEVREHDSDAVPILEAYLDRIAEGWREGDTAGNGGRPGPAPGGAMTKAEALEILGLDAGVDRAQIVAAHRRLMQKLHPDRGGNDYLAAQINRAKDVLLEE